MANYQNATELSKLTLGKSTQYCSEYTPDLLQGVPRSLNRDDLALESSNLPFVGEDVWYGFELSWLNEKGKPVVAVAEFRFACTSTNIVESKSFKLYLNSFNQTRFASIKQVEEILTKDLSNIAGSPAKVSLYGVDHCPALDIAKKLDNCFCIDGEDISIDHYQYDPELLVNAQDKEESTIVEEHLVSHLLKSNCLITNQPDWASVYIQYSGKAINHALLLKYLISFRQHNEFHEQCVERIYCDLQKFCQLEELTVFARYTRRGGLDINPFRSSHTNQAPFARTLRQ
ncbi:NADPH-dependent 7-cyano-7-deazaguanine reductase QueF [Colwellia psychrerythraea]|uniref:NADPH-dependent 7-cyano-7-deazaguanine reductase n=1 Tax=Colwellia psychrerythraea TaxID=28229 RepID=A0A099KZX6_COLPS|nr:NADPH-dependent 7-cyano-7-deazaguanine reductase QueF [Colwellia psychrerythraea]KGJ96126.1 NADPH-dependent 7-cyano-7-deazaguanine reductase [Colwellia psychrerythraea]